MANIQQPGQTPIDAATIKGRGVTAEDLTAYRALADDARQDARLLAMRTVDLASHQFVSAWAGPLIALFTVAVGLAATLMTADGFAANEGLATLVERMIITVVVLMFLLGGFLVALAKSYERRLASAKSWVNGYADVDQQERLRVGAKARPRWWKQRR